MNMHIKFTHVHMKIYSNSHLVCKLFDPDILNVWGRRKEKLDSDIIDYVKEKRFYYFPTEGGDKEEMGQVHQKRW